MEVWPTYWRSRQEVGYPLLYIDDIIPSPAQITTSSSALQA